MGTRHYLCRRSLFPFISLFAGRVYVRARVSSLQFSIVSKAVREKITLLMHDSALRCNVYQRFRPTNTPVMAGKNNRHSHSDTSHHTATKLQQIALIQCIWAMYPQPIRSDVIECCVRASQIASQYIDDGLRISRSECRGNKCRLAHSEKERSKSWGVSYSRTRAARI